jgi:hypothetical protein
MQLINEKEDKLSYIWIGVFQYSTDSVLVAS